MPTLPETKLYKVDIHIAQSQTAQWSVKTSRSMPTDFALPLRKAEVYTSAETQGSRRTLVILHMDASPTLKSRTPVRGGSCLSRVDDVTIHELAALLAFHRDTDLKQIVQTIPLFTATATATATQIMKHADPNTRIKARAKTNTLQFHHPSSSPVFTLRVLLFHPTPRPSKQAPIPDFPRRHHILIVQPQDLQDLQGPRGTNGAGGRKKETMSGGVCRVVDKE